MNIKHYVIAVGLMLLIHISSCKSTRGDVVPHLEVDRTELNIPATKSSARVAVDTRGASWSATVSADAKAWLYATKMGDDVLNVSVSANDDLSSRTGIVTITAGSISKQIKVTQLGIAPTIQLVEDKKVVDANGGDLVFPITSNIEYDVIVPDEDKTWINTKAEGLRAADLVTLEWVFVVQRNVATKARTTTITIKQKAGEVTKSIVITQEAFDDYPAISENDFKDDIKVPISSASTSSFQPNGGEIENSYDGNYNTLYHSNWSNGGANYFPITLEYFFADNTEQIDYLIYHPRKSHTNGNFKEVDIYVKTASDSDYRLAVSRDFGGKGTPTKVVFPTPLVKPLAVKFVVKSGAGDGQGFASCAEMEFYTYNDANADPLLLFTDATCSALKPDVTEEKIASVRNLLYQSIAYRLLDGTYPDEFRVQEYRAWPHPDAIARTLKISPQNLLDNPTGIAAQAGKELIVFVGDTKGYDLSIKVQNLDAPGGSGYGGEYVASYPLSEGINKIVPNIDGLIYLFYHTPNYESAPKIKVHFATGEVNGYFDSQKHKKEDWARLLKAAGNKFFDVVGKHAHLTFTTDGFRKYAQNTGLELINQYDNMLELMKDFMGLKKYNRATVNRTYFHTVYHSYMYATSYRTAFNFTDDGVVRTMCDVSTFRSSPWGHAHESGHTFQTRPGFKWQGTTEVTNNLHSVLVQTEWGNTSRLVAENRYDNALNLYAVDRTGVEQGWVVKPYMRAGGIYDAVFEKLVPMWQLYLYFTKVKGMSDFYKDFYEHIRTHQDIHDDATNMLNYTKITSDIAKTDLTDFFTVWNYYVPFKGVVDDYGSKSVDLSQQKIDQCLADIKGKNYQKPEHAIQYIRDDNIQLYKNNTPASADKAAFATSGGHKLKVKNPQGVVAVEVELDGKVVAIFSKPGSEWTMPSGVGVSDRFKVYIVSSRGTRTEVPVVPISQF